MIKPNITAAPSIRVMINVGATMDVPTGWFVTGRWGESLLLGGLATIDSVAGKGNNFKSAVIHFKTLSAVDRISNGEDSNITSYDTESNMHENRLTKLAAQFPRLSKINMFLSSLWIVTDKTVCYANTWFDKLKDFLKEKKKASKELTVTTPFLERDGKTLMKILMPTFSQIDSFSQVETDDTAAILDKTELGESEANHVYLRQGLAKKRLLDEYITEGPAASHYLAMAAHFGKDKAIGGGGGKFNAPPPKTMNSLKPGEKPKGVPDNFFYLTHSLWLADGAAKLLNAERDGPMYPKEGFESSEGGVDLYDIPLTMLRCKSGPSEYTLRIIASQVEGVLPSLTEFHAIKDNEHFGLDGNKQHYNLVLLPDVKLSRTTVRTKIDSDPKLRRGLNILSELMQMGQFYRAMRPMLPTPHELYAKLIEMGYDWDMILSKTRGWWTINNDKHELLFLSTMDLVNMYHGKYHPFWLAEDKKTIKPEFLIA